MRPELSAPNPMSHPAMLALWEAIWNGSNLLRQPYTEIHRVRMEPREGASGGFRIWVNDLEYHTDAHGHVTRGQAPQQVDDEIRLKSTIAGGITGRTHTFETDSDQLTAVEEQELRDLIAQSDFFAVETPDNAGSIPDGITHTLWIAVGRRNHTVVRGDGITAEDTKALEDLLAWAAARTRAPHQPA